MNNTIRLLRGELRFTEQEYKRFQKGDTIFGENVPQEEMKRWSIDKKEEAKAELAKYRCSYGKDYDCHNVTEYALEYSELDEDGEFVNGGDYDLAEEE